MLSVRMHKIFIRLHVTFVLVCIELHAFMRMLSQTTYSYGCKFGCSSLSLCNMITSGEWLLRDIEYTQLIIHGYQQTSIVLHICMYND